MRILFGVFVAIFLLSTTAALTGASCKGEILCDDQTKAICETYIPTGGTCIVRFYASQVVCQAYDQDENPASRDEDDCIGFTAVNPDPSGCDPSSPAYWAYCDPFAL